MSRQWLRDSPNTDTPAAQLGSCCTPARKFRLPRQQEPNLQLAGFAFADSWFLLLASAALMAAGSGVAHPALIALCVDRMADGEQGRATASFYLAFDLGIGMGNWLLGPVLGTFGLTWMYLLAAGISLLGVATTGLVRREA